MKRMNLILPVLILFIFGVNACSNARNKIQLISYLKGFGVVNGNEMRYYELTDNGQWIENTSYMFSLPKGYKSIIGFPFPKGAGVVIGNEMRYYVLYDNDNGQKIQIINSFCQQ